MRFSVAAAAAAVAVAAVSASGCVATTSAPARSPAVLTAGQVTTLRGAGAWDTAFGLRVLAALCERQPGANVVISPVSLAAGLGMAYLGARGATAATMANVLHLPALGPALTVGLRARLALLRSLSRPGITFSASNRVWADPTLVTNPGYLAALRAGYQAGLTHEPLLHQPGQAIRAMDAAIAMQTGGHIPHLLQPGSIPPNSIGWILTDALYLKAAWQHRFDPAKTAPGPFRTAAGPVTVRYMHGNGYAAAFSGGWIAAGLPYRGGRLAVLALLPPAGRPGCQVPGPADLRTLVHRLGRGPGEGHQIALPKVNLAGSYALKGVLTALGLGPVFSRRADFSGISPQAGRLAFVQHAATLTVDERGSVASAATAVGVLPTALPMPVIFNRPYLLLIRDTLTGEPLMLAFVANPAAHSR